MTFLLHNALRTDAAAIVPIFDTLVEQLNEVSREVETSIIEICSRFHGMAGKARDVVANTQINDQGSMSGTELVRLASRELASMLERLERASDTSVKNAKTMSVLRSGLDEVFDALSHIEKISSKARIVALNGQMEAVRAGSAGAAFAEVANQTRELAASVETSSGGIRDSVNQLGHRIVALRDEIHHHVESESQSLDECRDSVTRAMDQLTETQTRMESGIAFAETTAHALSQDIAQAVVLLQFQDAVCQRIAHVVFGLREMQSAIAQHLDDQPTRRVQRRTMEIMERLASQYTIATERQVHGNAHTQTDDLNIELF